MLHKALIHWILNLPLFSYLLLKPFLLDILYVCGQISFMAEMHCDSSIV